MQAFCRYDWPGNVRELMNVIERAMLLCKGDEITTKNLPNVLQEDAGDMETVFSGGAGLNLSSWRRKTLLEVQKEALDHVERLYLEMILSETGRTGGRSRREGRDPPAKPLQQNETAEP